MLRGMPRPARLLVLLTWMGLISFWSGQTNLPIYQPFVIAAAFGFQHRLAHLATFGLLALLARWTFDALPRSAVFAVLLTSLFGVVDERDHSLRPVCHVGVD